MKKKTSVAAATALIAVLAVSTTPSSASAESWRYFHATPAFATAHRSESVAVDTVKNLVYTTNPDEGTVTIIDGATSKPVGEPIDVGPAPWGIAVNSVTHKAYVTDSENGSVSVISGDKPAVTAVVPVESTLYGVAVDELRNLVQVVGYEEESGPFNDFVFAATLEGVGDTVVNSRLISQAPALNGGGGVAVDSASDTVYVVFPESGEVMTLSSALLTVEQLVAIPKGSKNVAVDSALGLAYIPNPNDHSVTIIDKTGKLVETVFDVSASPFAVAVDEVTQSVFVTDAAGRSVSVLDAATHALVGAPVEVGLHPSGIAFDRLRSRIWVANQGDSTVTAVDELATPDISLATPPSGHVGDPYSFTFRAKGSPAPTFTLTSGALPKGLRLNSSTGALSGTPTEAGSFTVTISARNTTSVKSEGRFTIAVTP
ncbi:hypothetical protein C5B96_05295 [Subtercola sp. Z020]|uniref:putative Ig domain-containing protein n=1 Tax=Subtercola sp. Z020 TaxID=2080582 RepID=UPI000CE8FE04|nr:putative Ig domain-containing protein [Subtercola sp. Z020]PPF86150.1 hypothetical protein C5B96_05295 [Subtercola sp. Z020]